MKINFHQKYKINLKSLNIYLIHFFKTKIKNKCKVINILILQQTIIIISKWKILMKK